MASREKQRRIDDQWQALQPGWGHTCTPSWEVPNGHVAVHTGGRTPKHDGSDDRIVGVGSHGGERN